MDRGEGFGRGQSGKLQAGKGFVMTSITAGRSVRKFGSRNESQDDLTGGRWGNRDLVAKVDVNDLA